jgi:hypothetical protein
VIVCDRLNVCAVAANCADIITFNIKDFIKAQLFDVRVLRPIEVLEELK